MDQVLTPALAAIFATMLMAAVVFGKDFLTNRSLRTNQESLRITLENVNLNAEIAARKAEIAAQQAKTAAEEMIRSKEVQTALAFTLEKVAKDAAASNVKQAEIGAKVDGHLSALNAKIAKLESLLTASELEVVVEKEKGATALQIEKERGETAARLATAQHAPETPTRGEQAGGAGAGAAPLQVTIPAVPAVTVPVEDKPLIITP